MNAPAKLPKAVVFDMDGTLLDTETPARIAFARAITDLGFVYQEPVYDRCIGTSHAETKAILTAAYGEQYDHEALHQRWSQRFGEHTRMHPVAVKPGVVPVLERLAELLIPMAVATSNRREVCEQHLLEAGLRDFFELFVCAEEAGKTKPAPDPYLLAVRKLNAAANDCWAVEDSVIGVMAAAHAGLKVFHIPDAGSNQDTSTLTMPRVQLKTAWELLDYL